MHPTVPAKLPEPALVQEWKPRHLLALMVANVALALGPWLVRLADTGPVAAAFWRMTLALPVIAMLALKEAPSRQHMAGMTGIILLGAGVFFALDLASWHVGITQTKLGNASLFGNSGSLIVMGWGLFAARRLPGILEVAAIGAALAGAALLMGGSLEISHVNLAGDLFCLLAGVFYAFYILMLNSARARIGQFSLLTVSMAATVPMLLIIALVLGETILPTNWTPLIGLAISSQLIGQGLLIYSLGNFTPLVIGLALLTQPAVSAATGWFAFGETLSGMDILGMALLAVALALAKAGDKPAATKG